MSALMPASSLLGISITRECDAAHYSLWRLLREFLLFFSRKGYRYTHMVGVFYDILTACTLRSKVGHRH